MPSDIKNTCKTAGKWSNCTCSYDISSNTFCNETNTVCNGSRSECTVSYTKKNPLPQKNGTPGICTEPIPKHYNINLDLCECIVERTFGEWIYTNPRCDPNNRTTFIANNRSRPITIKKLKGNKACLFNKLSDNESLLDTSENKIKGIMNQDGSLQFGVDNDNNGSTFQTIETENNINFPDNINCKCEGTYENWTNWSNWTNDTICPSATDYNVEDSAFNITQSRTTNRTFRISNSRSLYTNYSCPQQENINTQKKETRNYTCPRNCLGVWSDWKKCNGTCPDNSVTNNGSFTKIYTEGQTKQSATYTIRKPKLGSGDACTVQSECNNIVYGTCKDMYGLDIDPTKKTLNYTGIENGVKTITFNDIPGKKCPNPIRISCNIKCPFDCVHNGWKNVGTCKINTCINNKGKGTQTQEYDVILQAQNGGNPCLGPTKEVECYEDNHIECTQCGGKSSRYVPGATCENINSCEGLIGVGERIDRWSANSFNSLPGCIMPADIKIPCRTAGNFSNCACSYDISSNSFCNEKNTSCDGTGSTCNVSYTKKEPLPQKNGAPGICTESIPKHYNVNLDKCECEVERIIGDWIYTNPRCNPSNRTTLIADKRSRQITIKKLGGNLACSFNKLSDNEKILDTPDNKTKGTVNPNGSLQFGGNNDNIGNTFQTVETENDISLENNISLAGNINVVCNNDKSKVCNSNVYCPYLPTKIPSVCADGTRSDAARYNAANKCINCQVGDIDGNDYYCLKKRPGGFDYYDHIETNKICPSGYTDREKTNMICTQDCKSGYTYDETTGLCFGCEGTYSPMNWTDWKNNSNCPLPTNYTIGDDAFNITQSRTGSRTFTILNPNRLYTYCPQIEDINTKRIETRDFTCPRNCVGNWSEFKECNVACPDEPIEGEDNLTWTKTNKGLKTERISTFIIENGKTALGTGVACTDKHGTTKSQDCSASIECPYIPTKIPSICPNGNWYLYHPSSNVCTNCGPGFYVKDQGHFFYCWPNQGTAGLYIGEMANRVCPSGYTDREPYLKNKICTKDCKLGYTYDEKLLCKK
jgi:hypothetical protein